MPPKVTTATAETVEAGIKFVEEAMRGTEKHTEKVAGLTSARWSVFEARGLSMAGKYAEAEAKIEKAIESLTRIKVTPRLHGGSRAADILRKEAAKSAEQLTRRAVPREVPATIAPGTVTIAPLPAPPRPPTTPQQRAPGLKFGEAPERIVKGEEARRNVELWIEWIGWRGRRFKIVSKLPAEGEQWVARLRWPNKGALVTVIDEPGRIVGVSETGAEFYKYGNTQAEAVDALKAELLATDAAGKGPQLTRKAAKWTPASIPGATTAWTTKVDDEVAVIWRMPGDVGYSFRVGIAGEVKKALTPTAAMKSAEFELSRP